MIGTWHATAFETAQPELLAKFYQAILGGEIRVEADDWVELHPAEGGPHLAFQLSPGHVPPVWPGLDGDQQAHLDIAVADLDVAHVALLAVGARPVDRPDGELTGFRVYLDPSGHPFCTVD